MFKETFICEEQRASSSINDHLIGTYPSVVNFFVKLIIYNQLLGLTSGGLRSTSAAATEQTILLVGKPWQEILTAFSYAYGASEAASVSRKNEMLWPSRWRAITLQCTQPITPLQFIGGIMKINTGNDSFSCRRLSFYIWTAIQLQPMQTHTEGDWIAWEKFKSLSSQMALPILGIHKNQTQITIGIHNDKIESGRRRRRRTIPLGTLLLWS